MDKKFFETLRCIRILYQNFISIEVAVQELDGGSLNPTGSRCGSETPWDGRGLMQCTTISHGRNSTLMHIGTQKSVFSDAVCPK